LFNHQSILLVLVSDFVNKKESFKSTFLVIKVEPILRSKNPSAKQPLECSQLTTAAVYLFTVTELSF